MKSENYCNLHLGCGRVILPRYVNVDKVKLPGVDVVHDFSRSLPFASKSVYSIFCSHVLEHLDDAAALRLLEECRRVLRTGPEPGAIRFIVPDWDLAYNAYRTDPNFFSRPGLGIALEGTTPEQKLLTWVVRYRKGTYTGGPPISQRQVREAVDQMSQAQLLQWIKLHVPSLSPAEIRTGSVIDHQNGFNRARLTEFLEKAGFEKIAFPEVGQSVHRKGWERPEFFSRPQISLVVEATA